MAVAAITKVIINLLGKHGMSQGVMKATKLGFNRSQISKALRKFNKTNPPRTTFADRKESRIGPSAKEWKAMWRKDPHDSRNWQTGQTGPAHPKYGVPGIDW